MSCSTGSTIARASSGSRSRISSVEPLMSANSALTVLRSPSGSAAGAAGVREGADGLFSAAPQALQNLKRRGLSLPHSEQVLPRGVPQLPQNLVWDGLSYSQLGQSILARPFSQGTALRYVIASMPGWGYRVVCACDCRQLPHASPILIESCRLLLRIAAQRRVRRASIGDGRCGVSRIAFVRAAAA